MVPKAICLVKAGLPTPPNNSTNLRQNQVIIDFLLKMKQANYSDETTERYTRSVKTLDSRGADLTNPESIKTTLTDLQISEGSNQVIRNSIILFYEFNKQTINLPSYKRIEKIPFIPQENELDQLISGCKHQLATFLQVLKETASRYGEAINLKWIDYDTETMTLSITPEKGSNPRAIKISPKLRAMLNMLPKTTPKIFNYKDKNTLRKNFQRARKRIATNLGNPRILQIHFHTFRHWRATTWQHDYRDTWTVKTLLGHKSIKNTEKYIHIDQQLSGYNNDQYISKVAHNEQEECQLIELGFEHVADRVELHFYRKRK